MCLVFLQTAAIRRCENERIRAAHRAYESGGSDMRIGVPTEIKVHEYRVGLVPAAVRELVAAGHEVAVQSGAGRGIGCSAGVYPVPGARIAPTADGAFRAAGARIAPTADAIFKDAQLIVKVKEPQLSECVRLRGDQVLFTYLH